MSLACLLIPPATGQDVILTLTNTPSPVTPGSPIGYSLVVSNTGQVSLPPGTVLSRFPTNAQVLAATNSQGGAILTNTPGTVEFEVPDLSINAVATLGLTLRTTQPGRLTNTFTLTTPASGSPLLELSTNAVVRVLPVTDLGVALDPPQPGVFVGDTFSWRLRVTNSGPDAAPSAILTNPLPPGVSFLSGTPSAQVSLLATQVLFTVGTLSTGASAEATLHLLATAAGTNDLAATVGTPESVDPNPTNNTFLTNLVILAPDTNVLVASIISTQTFVPQTGLMEQRIHVTNTSPNAVASFRVLIDGVTNPVVNASGTNAGVPFVSHGAVLAGNAALELLLEYFHPSRQPGADPVLTAYPTPALELSPRPGTSLPVTRLVPLTNSGRVLLEFASTPGARYQVHYGPDVGSNSFLGSLPEITAGATRTQWTDYGPPRTTSKPTEAPARFYRVVQLP